MVLDGPSAKRRKKRLPIACLPCRRKKERCDRVVPGCSNCRRRDVECRWGDARDAQLDVHQSSSAAGQQDKLVRGPDSTSKSIEELASGQPTIPVPDLQDVYKKLQPLITRVVSHLPPKEQAYHLTQTFLDLPHHLYYCIGMDDFLASLETIYSSSGCLGSSELVQHDRMPPTPSSPSSGQVPLDHLTRLLFVLAASARQSPPSYLVALGVASSGGAVQPRITLWLDDALACFDACQQHGQMSFSVLQATTVFFVWLVDCTHISRYAPMLDAATRAAAQLGLDRLASPRWDRKYKQSIHTTGQERLTWGAELLLQGDLIMREHGRAVWHALALFYGAFSPCNPDPLDELATTFPEYESQSEDYNPFGCWRTFHPLSIILTHWRRLQSRAEAVGIPADYQSMQDIYARLQHLAKEQAPAANLTSFELRRESGETSTRFREREKRVAQLAWSALLLQLKILLIHRPLMGAGYEDPAMHGFSVTVAVESAHCILQGAHRFRDMEWTHYQSAFGMNALMQAGLVLLLDLFHKPRSLESTEGRDSYRHISIAIEQLKNGESSRHPSSILYNAASKLEGLMSACARRGSFYVQSSQVQDSQTGILSRTELLTDYSWLDNLDWQLFQAAYGPQAVPQSDAMGRTWPRQGVGEPPTIKSPDLTSLDYLIDGENGWPLQAVGRVGE